MDDHLPSCSVELSVPFHDLDPLGVVWHGNYLKYFEIARDALFGKHGINLYEYCRNNECLLPIVRVSVKHVHPLRFGDAFICEARLVDTRLKLVLDYEIRLKNTETLCTRGRTEQVAVNASDLKLELQIPAELQRAFGLRDDGSVR